MDIKLAATGLITNYFEFYIASYFLKSFMTRQYVSEKLMLLLFVPAAVIHYIVNLIKIPALNSLAGFVLVFAISLCYSGKPLKKVSFSIVFVAISAAAEMIYGFITLIFSSASVRFYMNDDFSYFLTGVIGKVILFTIVQLIVSVFKGKFKADSPVELFCLSIFPGFAVAAMTALIHITEEYSMTVANTLIVIFLLFGILASSVMVFFLYGQAISRVELVNELKLERQSNEMQKQLYQQQQHNIDEFNGFRHDIKNHLLNIILLLKQQHFDQLKAYCHEQLDLINDLPSLIDFNNYVLSNIFARLAHTCEENGIALDCDIRYRDFAFLHPTDASTIFDNIFDNAVAACSLIPEQGQRSIIIKINRLNQYIVIDLVNAKVNEILTEDNAYLSTKREYTSHGYGIKRVKSAVEQYDGYVTISHDVSSFNITIRLPVPVPERPAQ